MHNLPPTECCSQLTDCIRKRSLIFSYNFIESIELYILNMLDSGLFKELISSNTVVLTSSIAPPIVYYS